MLATPDKTISLLHSWNILGTIFYIQPLKENGWVEKTDRIQYIPKQCLSVLQWGIFQLDFNGSNVQRITQNLVRLQNLGTARISKRQHLNMGFQAFLTFLPPLPSSHLPSFCPASSAGRGLQTFLIMKGNLKRLRSEGNRWVEETKPFVS